MFFITNKICFISCLYSLAVMSITWWPAQHPFPVSVSKGTQISDQVAAPLPCSYYMHTQIHTHVHTFMLSITYEPMSAK